MKVELKTLIQVNLILIQTQERFMKNGYKILWTDFALKELQKTIEYLEENWTEKELRNLAENIEEKVALIS